MNMFEAGVVERTNGKIRLTAHGEDLIRRIWSTKTDAEIRQVCKVTRNGIYKWFHEHAPTSNFGLTAIELLVKEFCPEELRNTVEGSSSPPPEQTPSLLSRLPLEELVAELVRRGGKVTFG